MTEQKKESGISEDFHSRLENWSHEYTLGAASLLREAASAPSAADGEGKL